MPKIKNNPFTKDDWDTTSLESSWIIIEKLAAKYGLTYYKPNFEVVSFEDMLHIYTGSLPINYDHWSFGKKYEEIHKRYMNDHMGVAYEVIFNTNPALCYLLEHNSPTMQGLVQCHAAVGHSAFFCNNVFFKEMTNANSIVPFLKNGKKFIKECEEKYGTAEVERLLDVCHSLDLYAIDRRPVINKTIKEKELIRVKRALEKDQDYDVTTDTISLHGGVGGVGSGIKRLHEENILKFIGKNSPALKSWQREIIDIYCKIQQYLYPQVLTKMMNEGFASFWHHTLMSDLGDMGYLEPGQSLEFLHSHCSVLGQVGFDDPRYGGINPYKLGYEIFKDIKRICTDPTDEDKEWFPGLIGKDWVEEIKFAAYNFKDESFILQYLSPKLMRDFKLFVLKDDASEDEYEVSDIHDDEGYKAIRSKLSKSYNIMNNIPDVFVEGWDPKKRRTLYLVFKEQDCIELEEETAQAVGFMIKSLWPFPVNFKWRASNGEEETYEF